MAHLTVFWGSRKELEELFEEGILDKYPKEFFAGIDVSTNTDNNIIIGCESREQAEQAAEQLTLELRSFLQFSRIEPDPDQHKH
jgi:hypothetical protein